MLDFKTQSQLVDATATVVRAYLRAATNTYAASTGRSLSLWSELLEAAASRQALAGRPQAATPWPAWPWLAGSGAGMSWAPLAQAWWLGPSVTFWAPLADWGYVEPRIVPGWQQLEWCGAAVAVAHAVQRRCAPQAGRGLRELPLRRRTCRSAGDRPRGRDGGRHRHGRPVAGADHAVRVARRARSLSAQPLCTQSACGCGQRCKTRLTMRCGAAWIPDTFARVTRSADNNGVELKLGRMKILFNCSNLPRGRNTGGSRCALARGKVGRFFHLRGSRLAHSCATRPNTRGFGDDGGGIRRRRRMGGPAVAAGDDAGEGRRIWPLLHP